MAEAPTNPAQAFPAGDPRNALYGETITDLRHQFDTTLNELTGEEGKEKANDLYAQEQITKAEPGAFLGQQNRFDKGGLLQSGIFGRERGNLHTQFTGKHFAISHREQEAGERRTTARQRAKEKLEQGEHGAVTKTLIEGYNNLLASNPQEQAAPQATATPQAQGTPGTPGVPAQPTGPRVIRPYLEPLTARQRREAAARVVGRKRQGQ